MQTATILPAVMSLIDAIDDLEADACARSKTVIEERVFAASRLARAAITAHIALQVANEAIGSIGSIGNAGSIGTVGIIGNVGTAIYLDFFDAYEKLCDELVDLARQTRSATRSPTKES